MRLTTWNVNSVRARVERVLAFLERSQTDVLALQELKCKPEQFPFEAFENAGYQVAMTGFNQWNGVAILSRVGLEDIQESFPHQPGFADPATVEARALGANCAGVEVWSLYVPHGRALDHPHYQYKLQWLENLANYAEGKLQANPAHKLALVGDWNIAPLDEDVWDINAFADSTHVSPLERSAFQRFQQIGMEEVTRERVTNYTYWDYQKLRFPKNEGMRIDFVYASEALAQATVAAQIDRDERKGKGASDHVPVIVDFDV
ncbi:MAG: exodeoxyribonuclease III [Actinomycetaceae bacterium]|nr:exodeoxyribonuclease III [Actinomycetaceae bacterium]